MMEVVLWFNLIVVPLAAVLFIGWVAWMLRDRWMPLCGGTRHSSRPSDSPEDDGAG